MVDRCNGGVAVGTWGCGRFLSSAITPGDQALGTPWAESPIAVVCGSCGMEGGNSGGI